METIMLIITILEEYKCNKYIAVKFKLLIRIHYIILGMIRYKKKKHLLASFICSGPEFSIFL